MSRSRAATPAGKRRTSARGAARTAAPRPHGTPDATAHTAPPKRSKPKHPNQPKPKQPKRPKLKRSKQPETTKLKRSKQSKTTKLKRGTPKDPKQAKPKRPKPKRARAPRPATERPAPSGRAPRRTAAASGPARRRSAATGARPATRRRAPAPRLPGSWSRPRPLRAARRLIAAARWRDRLAALAVVVVALVGGYLFWLRDTSVVAVTNVDVVGVSGGDREQIVAELTDAAEQQTTLHADPAAIEAVAATFATIESVSVDPNFPHGMRIEVAERPPTLLVDSGDRRLAAAADGSLLAGVEVDDPDSLPVLEVKQMPPGGTLEGEPLEQALVVGAAPEPLRPLIEKVDYDGEYGVELTLRGGIPVRFGTGTRAAQKWASTAAVLADPKLDALTYLDVRVPERPAAGGAG